MAINLPTGKAPAVTASPSNLIIFSKPKTGKTTLIAELDNCLLLDLENGSNYVSAMKIQANSIADIKEIGTAIFADNKPYDYIAVDTITKLEDICIPYAEELYSKTPMGKNWFNPENGGKLKYGNILGLPEGAGYFWTRQAFTKVIDYILTWAPYVIFVGHVKDTQLEKTGGTFNAMDLDLTGKLKRITTSNSDAIGYLYRKGNKNILSFKTNDEISCGARPEHLRNEEIVISEVDENGEYTTHWDKVFID
jgi:hypothetical protein